MVNNCAKGDAIVQGAVSSQGMTPTTRAEGTLQLCAFANAINGAKHVQSVHISPSRHDARTDTCTHALAQQEWKIELRAVVSDKDNVLVWLHRRGKVLVVFRILISIENTE